MLRLAVVAGNRSDEWCSRLAARFADVAIERLDNKFLERAGDVGRTLTTGLSPFDAVWTSSSQHAAEISLAAARAGKHLIVDLPVLLASANLDALYDAVAAGGGQCLLGNSQRFLPAVQVVKEQLDAGKLGQPGLLRVHHWHAAREEHQGLATSSLVAGLIDHIDLACWLFGGSPTQVFAGRQSPSAVSPSPDYAQLHLGFPGGGMALLDNWRGVQAGPGYFSLSLIGSSGAVYADDHHDMQLLFHDGPLTALRREQEQHAAKNQIEDLLSALREQREPDSVFGRARRLLRVAATVAEALESSQPLCA